MLRRGRWRDAGTKGLDGDHSQAVASCNLRIRVVAHYQNFAGSEPVRPKYGFEDLELPLRTRLINGINMDLSEQIGDAEGSYLAFLQSPKSRGNQEALCAEFGENAEVAIAVHRLANFHLAEDGKSSRTH